MRSEVVIVCKGEQRDVALIITYQEEHFLHINANVPGLFFYPV